LVNIYILCVLCVLCVSARGLGKNHKKFLAEVAKKRKDRKAIVRKFSFKLNNICDLNRFLGKKLNLRTSALRSLRLCEISWQNSKLSS
jgi:hypothetical protein